MKDTNFWKKYFSVYDYLNLLPTYKQLINDICANADIKNGDVVLEAGCGTGNLAILLKQKGARVVCLDNCKEALEICQAKDRALEVIQADLTSNIPFPDNYFDKVVSNNTLYAISKNKQLPVLKEMHRVLKPNGKIVIANLRQGWKPAKIYLRGIREIYRQKGLLKTILTVLQMIRPTVMIFYYNLLIGRESDFHFLNTAEQKKLLQQVGLIPHNETVMVYADQSILDVATKKI